VGEADGLQAAADEESLRQVVAELVTTAEALAPEIRRLAIGAHAAIRAYYTVAETTPDSDEALLALREGLGLLRLDDLLVQMGEDLVAALGLVPEGVPGWAVDAH
jgi:hypothetical protein